MSSFSSILLDNGSVGTTPLSAGDVNVGEPGFLLEWLIENDGSTSWNGDYSLDVPAGWTYQCTPPGVLQAGSSAYLTCTDGSSLARADRALVRTGSTLRSRS